MLGSNQFSELQMCAYFSALWRRSGLAVMLVGSLLLVGCERNDPRYPVYYRYRVDVKVDGVPVTIERVIKCTGTLVTDLMVSPGATTGADYRNPPVIGAKVPGSKAAVYTPVIGACSWASASRREIEEDKKRVHQFLAQPFTEEHRKLKPDSKMPVLWVNDSETFDRMEYYVSETGLSGKHGHVEFIKAYPPVKVDKQAFKASEKRAETESPDLTPFIFPETRTTPTAQNYTKNALKMKNFAVLLSPIVMEPGGFNVPNGPRFQGLKIGSPHYRKTGEPI